jgi:hypothetical protein
VLKRLEGSQTRQLRPVILAIWEAEIGRVKVPGQPRQIVHRDAISKITTGRVVQVPEHLSSKCEALSSNSSTTKKN